MKTETARLATLLDEVYQGEPWHGPPLRNLLQGLTAFQASMRAIEGGHTIWEIVLHLKAWKDVVRRRLEGETVRALSGAADWPPIQLRSEPGWASVRDELDQTHRRLVQAVKRMPDSQLSRIVPGVGGTVYTMVHGVAHHDLYHAGQLALLRKGVL